MAFLTEHDAIYKTKEDICAHVGDDYAEYKGAIVPPIFQNSLFLIPTEDNGAPSIGYNYTRVSNPTIEVAERKVAALEGADGALCFASGMGALTAAIMHFAGAGRHVVMIRSVYGVTRVFLTDFLEKRFGVAVNAVNGDSTDEILSRVRPETSLILLESPSSAVFKLQDLQAIADFARPRGIATVIDNSWATPLYQNPLAHGIDLVCHSASKYLGGHSDIIGGVAAGSRELIGKLSGTRFLLGANMDPHQAWLLSRGLRTLPVRLARHSQSALAVARFLEAHPRVRRVLYPALDSFPQRDLARRYLSGCSGLLSFVPDGAPEGIKKMISKCRYFQHGVSWGGFESLIVGISVGADEQSAAAGDSPANLVRLHVGLEDPDSLIADLDQALGWLDR
ncbi:MAG: aminotransferase class I/II-fold pyridoxal phosphate-dependent enzyme [Clostridiales bacterium]|jgi:cystathionine beta-lyase|nr:aminotransferase class I/II-fold pyridoxal phosphate-dependent enzyme [Clostridiales bacterium]